MTKQKYTLAFVLCAFAPLAAHAQKPVIKALQAQPLKTAASPVNPNAIKRLTSVPAVMANAAAPNKLSNAGTQPLAHAPQKAPSLRTQKADELLLSAPQLTRQTKFLTPEDRSHWKELREKFASVSPFLPLPEDLLPYFIKPSVPPEESEVIQQKYAEVTRLIAETKQEFTPVMVYSSLAGEAKTLHPQKVGELSNQIYSIIYKIRNLRTALPDDPFLAKQEEAWLHAYLLVNPVAGGIAIIPHKDVHAKNRVFDFDEFNLLNPDGTDYLLPNAKPLQQAQPEQDVSAAHAPAQAPAITPQEAQAECEALLQNLPAGQRIAFINPDPLPRTNFENWAQKGYLGRNTTLETFTDGNAFMEKINQGAQFDIVLTELLYPAAGHQTGRLLRKTDKNTPLIACSKLERENLAAQDLFDTAGFDGFIWYNTNMANSDYGYIEYLRAMKNYYYYKSKYNWQR